MKYEELKKLWLESQEMWQQYEFKVSNSLRKNPGKTVQFSQSGKLVMSMSGSLFDPVCLP